MPPPKRGQASFAKKKVEVDPEEEKRKKAEYDAAQKKKRLEAAKRFSVGGTVDLAEFMDDDPDMSVTAKLQQVMSTAKESGLKVQQIFSYFKPNGKLEGDITPEDFGAAMHKLGWKCTDEQLKTLLDDFDEDGNGTISIEEFQAYCYQIPNIAWKAERLRWQREQEAEKKRKEEAKKKRRSRKSSAGEKTGVEEEEEVDPGPPPPTPVEQIYEGQKPLWKTKQMLCIKIGYAEEKNCLAISCKDAEENLFPPVFLDASKILQAKGSEFEALIEEDIEKKEKSGTKKLEDSAKAIVAKEVTRQAMADFTLKRLITSKADPLILEVKLLGSDGALDLETLVLKENPNVELLPVLNETEAPSAEDFANQIGAVAAERDKVAAEREEVAKALRRVKQALDAFKVGKGWKDMNTRERCVFLLQRFGVRHVITKVEKMLETSPTYAALLEEQAAKRAKAARKK